jgi:hypothetical protein
VLQFLLQIKDKFLMYAYQERLIKLQKIITYVQSTAHRTVHFGLCTALSIVLKILLFLFIYSYVTLNIISANKVYSHKNI